ncbi:MAG: hypothetical protein IJI27_07840 [Oscillospiraceae bacterium]|nr:hypothetical protein [Oscillospiraceae bacterium]
MCSECHCWPHLPGCPNAPEPKAIYTCQSCGDGIVAGDEYAEIDGDYYHEGCLPDMSLSDLLGIFGVMIETAQED